MDAAREIPVEIAGGHGPLSAEPTSALRPLWRQPRVWGAAFIVCVILVALSVAFLDRPISRFSHDHIGRSPLFYNLQYPPDVLTPLAAVLVAGLGLAWMFGVPPSRAGRTAFAASVALMVAVGLKEQLKYVFGRTWPETFVNNNPSFIQDGVYGFFFFHGGAGYASFPSGHMTVSTTVAMVIACAYPRLRPLCLLLPVLVAIGLVGMDYHFLGDMIAGSFLGAGVGIGAAGLAGLMPSSQ